MATYTGVQQQSKRAIKQAEEMPSNAYMGAVLGSMALSALLFMLGRRNLAIFVGLWPPTILNLGLFTKILRPSHEAESETPDYAERPLYEPPM